MIVDFLFAVIEGVVTFIGGLFPDDDSIQEYVDGLQLVIDNVAALNYFLPIAELFATILGFMVVFPVFMGVSLFTWLLSQIRGSGS